MAKVQVIIEEVVKGAGNIDGVTKDLKDLNQTADKSQSFTQRASTSFTEFNAALGLVKQGVQVLGQVYQETAGKTIEYANEVRKLSQVSGASAEDTSRLIQVLDDYKISSDQALASTRYLTKNGHVATLETLGKLSDEYLKLNSQQEKNAFVTKELGRGGMAYISILEKGSAAIKKQGDAVSANLILSQKVVDDARKQEIALDSLGDSWDGLMMTIGKTVIPIANDAANGFNVYIRATQDAIAANGYFKTTVWDIWKGTDAAAQGIWEEQQALLANKDAAAAAADGTDELAQAQTDAEEAAKRLTGVYQGLLSAMFDIQGGNDALAGKLKDADEKEAELTTKKAEVLGEYLKKKQEIDASNESGAKKQQQNTDATVEYAKALADLDKGLAENAQSKVDAQKELEDAGKKRVYDLTQQKLAADGVVSTGEYEYLQKLAVSMGLVTQAAADQAVAENQRADALAGAFGKIESPMQRDLALMQKINSYNGVTVQFGVNYQSNTPTTTPTPTYNGNPYASSSLAIGAGNISGGGRGRGSGVTRDSGGSGIAGTAYQIGVPEIYVPKTGGQFIPLGGAKGIGATYNITINNPVKEAAENSIRSALKKLSFTGTAA